MANIFNTTARGKVPPRTTFDLSHDVKLSTEIGKLTPIFCEPVLPSDRWKCRAETFIRFSPMLAPIMQRMSCFTHWFFVPNRLPYKLWEPFITGDEKVKETPVYPRFVLTPATYNSLPKEAKYYYFGPGSLIDYLGFPTLTDENGQPLESISNIVYFDAIPIIDYYLIWYNFYRDENLDPDGIGSTFNRTDSPAVTDALKEQIEDIVQGNVNGEILMEPFSRSSFLVWEVLFSNQYRAWEKDYFTSALPWPQKGPDVLIPGTSLGDVTLSSNSSINKLELNNVTLRNPMIQTGTTYQNEYDTVSAKNDNKLYVDSHDHTQIKQISGGTLDGITSSFTANSSQLNSFLSNIDVNSSSNGVSDATINNLRRALDLQRFLESEGRGGTRYPEWLRQIFAVFPGDYELQRPVYLGGGRTNVVVSEVLQQSATAETPDGEDSPLGDYAGRAVTAGSHRAFKYLFKEYGYVIGIMSIRPRSSYMQGLPRKYQKTDRFDFGIPHFAHLGEQEVKNSELFFDPNASEEVNNGTFGYQSRYAEYKFLPSRTCGDMRGNLDFWHLTRKFSGLPGLNRKFIYINPEQNNRIFAVEKQLLPEGDGFVEVNLDHLYCQVYIDLKAKRPLPRYGIPR